MFICDINKKYNLKKGHAERILKNKIWKDEDYKPLKIRKGKNFLFSIEKANEIREKYQSGLYTYGDLADEYNTKISSIQSIINNKNWKNEDYIYIKKCGENHPTTKLTCEKVIEIRRKYSTGTYSYSQLSKEYDINVSTLHSIIHYKTWVNI